MLDPYYSFLALLALEELSSSIFSPDVACNGKFEIKTKLQTLLYNNAVYALKKDTLAKFAFFYQVQTIYEEPINTNIKLESLKKSSIHLHHLEISNVATVMCILVRMKSFPRF